MMMRKRRDSPETPSALALSALLQTRPFSLGRFSTAGERSGDHFSTLELSGASANFEIVVRP